jgi:hypothetical protein
MELIPQGARINLRGFMNINAIQPNLDWIWPYWITKQYDPTSPSFIPRAMMWVSLNSTHRNWTGIGNLNEKQEAIVDPRGLVTPWWENWSLDTWVVLDGSPGRRTVFAPSRLDDGMVRQRLADAGKSSEVTTLWETPGKGLGVEQRAWPTTECGSGIVMTTTLTNTADTQLTGILYFAIRPANPEGVALVFDVSYHKDKRWWLIDGQAGLYLGQTPQVISTGTNRTGDVSLFLDNPPEISIAHCNAGLASGLAGFTFTLDPGESLLFWAVSPTRTGISLAMAEQTWNGFDPGSAHDNHRAAWQAAHARGIKAMFPDERLQQCFDANRTHLLMLYDVDEITPGPAEYHHFWFRDSAYLLYALEVLGYAEETSRAIGTYPSRQRKDGFFISQNGEWDSNGQAIFAIWEHYLLTRDRDFLLAQYPGVAAGARWIERKRHTTGKGPHEGLLPPGFSAEHLGPNDYFYWDDFWGLAGLRAAREAARTLGREEDERLFDSYLQGFWEDVKRSLETAQTKIGGKVIPASPYRRPDSGMIGGIAALYPLHLLSPLDPMITSTVQAIREHWFIDGVFYQNLLHSGLNCYLTLQIAECLLFQGDAECWPMANWFIEHQYGTFTWPEALHPVLKTGGCMGDGHHGWACADWLIFLRNSLLYEQDETLVIAGAPTDAWYTPGKEFGAEDAPTHFGDVSYRVKAGRNAVDLTLSMPAATTCKRVIWRLPFQPSSVVGIANAQVKGSTVEFSPVSGTLTAFR